MKKLLSLIFNAALLVIIGLLALSILIWIVGPQVSIAEWRPLEGVAARGVLIGAIFGLYLVRVLWRAWRARRDNGAVVKQLLTPPPRAAASAEPGEPEVLRQRFEAAVQTLRSARFASTRGVWDSLSARMGRRYLYELPWYTIIGSPGAGKTTALRNSGLRFPLAAALGQDATRGLKGVAGTRNIEWWFTDEAVLIDTAGRYTTQDSDPGADGQAWSAFLALLKKSRPRMPVNGVLVTVSVPDLLGTSVLERAQQAQALRSRVQELHQQLGVRFPIYLLVTKCDLLSGFMDYLGNADRDTRAAPWGFTFGLDAQQRSDGSTFLPEFDALGQRLVDGVIDRLQAERDVERRARIYGFPQQFCALREVLREFVDTVFSPSQFEAHPLLRGVYFISGTQEGTPLDRVIGSVARAYGLESALLPPNRSSGKSFFLERLLREVVFAESELGGTDLKWERRRGWLAAAGYAGIASVAALLLGAWAVSYANNRAFVDAVAARVDGVKGRVLAAGGPGSSNLLALLPGLRATRELAAGDAQNERAGLLGFGLYQGRKLDAAAGHAYEQALIRSFLPRLVARLDEQLKNSTDNPELEYEALKAYVMLHDPRHFDAAALKAHFAGDWDANLPAGVTREQRAELDEHLATLFARGAVVSPTAEDRALTSRVRSELSAMPLAQRVYSRMKRLGLGENIAEFSIAKAGGPAAGLVFRRASGKPLTQGVAGLYTYEGYHQALQKEVEATTQRLGNEEGWVLGAQDAARIGKRLDAAELKRLSDEVRKLYLADYAATWQGFIADIRLLPTDNLDKSIQMTRVLTSADSPLKPLLAGLVRQTTLGAPASASLVDQATYKAQTGIDKATAGVGAIFGKKPKIPNALPAGAPIESIVDDKFTALREQMRAPADAKGPAPIDKTIAMLDELLATLTAAQVAQRDRSPPPPSKQPVVEIAKLPEPLRSLVETLSASGNAAVVRQGIVQVMEDMRADVGEFCRKAVAGRYPVVRSSALDIRPADFADLFAPGGRMDKFFQKHLANRVDTSRQPWVSRTIDGQPAVIGTATLIQFQRAAAIRDTFFQGGAAGPTLRLQLAPMAMDSSILSFILDVDGQIVRYAHGPSIPVSVQWPGPQGSAQVRVQLSPPAALAPSGLLVQGPWALLRLFDGLQLTQGDDPARFRARFDVGGRKAEFEVTANSVLNPFRLRELTEFSCPGGA